MIDNAWDKKDYITGICLINYFLTFDSTKAYLYYNRSIAKAAMNDFSGSCEDLQLARQYSSKYSKNLFYRRFCDEEHIIRKLEKYYYPGEQLAKTKRLRPAYTERDTLRGQLSPPRSSYDVTYYDLKIKIFPKSKSIQGFTDIYFDVKNNTNQIQIDLADNLQVDSIKFAEEKLDYVRKYNAIFIRFNEVLLQDSKQNVLVYYSGKPKIAVRPPWQAGFVWSHKSFNQFISVCCEQLGASCWWPNKDHLSDKPDSMRITVDVPEKYKAISNGSLVRDYNLNDDYHRFIWKVSYPIVNYGVTFYCGNYLTIKDSLNINGDKLYIDYYVLPKDKSEASILFSQSKEVLKVYSELFGPYPFPKDGFALVESPYEGMEHQGAIAYGDNFKHRRKVYDNNSFDYIIVHEIAHEWWGNSVSFSDMADAWLSEGFATYSELLFMEKVYGYSQYRKELRRIMASILNIWPVRGNYNVNENSFIGGDIYTKGAIILHNLRCLMNNDEVFMRLIRDYYQKYKYQSISTKSFIEMASSYSELNLEPFFDKFLNDSRPPVLTYNLVIDNDNVTFIYKWSDVKPGFMMPFQISDNNNNLYSLEGVTDISYTRLENAESVMFNNFLTDNEKNDNIQYTYFVTRFDPDLK